MSRKKKDDNRGRGRPFYHVKEMMAMGEAIGGATCYICGEWFLFRPGIVPRAGGPNGIPMCRKCIDAENEAKNKQIEYNPDAYVETERGEIKDGD